MKKKSEDYIKGFKHGINWYRTMMRATTHKWKSPELDIELDNVFEDSKEAIKSLRKGR